jgi:DNA modification methylase
MNGQPGRKVACEGDWEAIRARAVLSSTRYALLAGNALQALQALPSESIATCLTSPPYWGARDYEHDKQLGLEPELDGYVGNLVKVFREVRRLLTERGTVWLNVGDCYFHGAGTVNGRPPPTGWKRNKQLCLVPFRLAMALQEDGWWVRNAVVWHKPNAMPASVRDRLANTWEPLFLLAKSEKYYFDLDAIRIPHQTDDKTERVRAQRGNANGKAKGQKDLRRWLNSPRHRATIEGLREIRRRPNAPDCVELASYLRSAMEKQGVDIYWVAAQLGLPYERTRHYFRTDRIGSRLPPEEVWEQLKALLDLDTTYDDAMAVEVGDNVFRNHPKGRNPGDMISVTLSGASQEHFATMPMALAEWALKATLPPGGICLDPFMGTGTTGIAAINLGGRFLGVDVRRDFLAHFVKWAESRRRHGQRRKGQVDAFTDQPDLFSLPRDLAPDELER